MSAGPSGGVAGAAPCSGDELELKVFGGVGLKVELVTEFAEAAVADGEDVLRGLQTGEPELAEPVGSLFADQPADEAFQSDDDVLGGRPALRVAHLPVHGARDGE